MTDTPDDDRLYYALGLISARCPEIDPDDLVAISQLDAAPVTDGTLR